MPIRGIPAEPAHNECRKAWLVLKHAHETATWFLELFEKSVAERRAPNPTTRGTSTDEERDLLRAMVVFAAAGLDAMLKQLVRDALPELIAKNQQVRKAVHKFLQESIRKDDEGDLGDCRWQPEVLLKFLFAAAPHTEFIDDFVTRLTARSLQSTKALKKVTSLLGVDPADWGISETAVGSALDVRNKVVHEMDTNFSQWRRVRQHRARDGMTEHANGLLGVGESILQAVDGKL